MFKGKCSYKYALCNLRDYIDYNIILFIPFSDRNWSTLYLFIDFRYHQILSLEINLDAIVNIMDNRFYWAAYI